MGPHRRHRNGVTVDFRGPLRYWNRYIQCGGSGGT